MTQLIHNIKIKYIKSQMVKYSFVLLLCVFILSFTVAFATAPLEYNIVPETKVNSIIDINYQKKLNFKVIEYTQDIFYEGKPVKLKNNSFSIDVSKTYGNKSIKFTNSNNESVEFKYLFSDKKGKLENYELVSGKKLNVYVTTIKDIRVIYTDKEKSTTSKLKNYLNKLPKNMLKNINEFKMIPFSNTQNIAGTTRETTIILYNFNKYNATTQKNILYHEIAHTWANKLMDKKYIDYDYTDYKTIVEKDNNYVSSYARDFAKQNKGKLSEDFADAIAFHFMNPTKFKKQYPNRTNYFKKLLEIEL